MEVDASWRRKRPVEEEEEDYLASKRYISEKFFNMRISHPEVPGVHAGSMWQGAAGNATRVEDVNGEVDCISMSDADISPAADLLSSLSASSTAAAAVNNNDGFSDLDLLDEDDDSSSSNDSVGAAAGGGPPTPHPFLRSASSAVDEKVDDWVRASRHRMLADASVNSAPDLCRALILYKPVVALGSSASGEEAHASSDGEDDGGEGGGDPTPSPQTGGDGGGETAPSAAGPGLGDILPGGQRRIEQNAGSSTAEAAGFTGGGGRTDRPDHQHVSGSLFGPPPRGLCTAQSGGDDAGGALKMRDDRSAAAMQMTGRDSAGRGGFSDSMDMDAMDMAPPESPVLTRVGTSRGAPTPGLTPERASHARAFPQRRSQGHGPDWDGIAASSNPRPPLSAPSWAAW